MAKILVVEDNDTLRRGVAQAFRDSGHEVEALVDGQAAVDRLQSSSYDVVLTDLKLPKCSGLEVLRAGLRRDRGTTVIVMTAYGTIATAVEAMKEGAYDFIQKPFNLEEMEVKVKRALDHRQLVGEVEYLRNEQHKAYSWENVVGMSQRMREAVELTRKVAPSKATVLISGETGTGKELIAGMIHASSPRRHNHFVKVNCAALQENLLESELFGHEKGAFTGADRQRVGRFEQANGGTILLDEVGDMSASTQAKVLRVLQEEEFERLGSTRTLKVDVRVVAATNKNLREAIEKGEFREDLYYRLNVVSISIPPLRERREDIEKIALFYLKRYATEMNKPLRGFSANAISSLKHYNWPGNVRELKNTLERAVLMAEGARVEARDLALPEGFGPGGSPSGLVRLPPSGVDFQQMEKEMILEALRMNNWVQKDAAKFLGMSRRVIHYKIQKLGIKNEKWRKNRQSLSPSDPPEDSPVENDD
jgi:DNA-binding NtrC family response regulator